MDTRVRNHQTTQTKQTAGSPHTTDEAADRALYERLMDGWNQGSGEAFASVFTEDGDLDDISRQRAGAGNQRYGS